MHKNRLTLLVIAMFLLSASAAIAIPICGNGVCERNTVPAENIYNCPEDCCGALRPAPEDDGLSFLENEGLLMTPVAVEPVMAPEAEPAA